MNRHRLNDNRRAAKTPPAPPVVAATVLLDQAHLDRRTRRDASLEVEILALFVSEGERLVGQITSAPAAERRGRIAALRSLATQVGAGRLADACRTAGIDENADNADASGESGVEKIRAAFEDVRLHILESTG